jgi:hypothetical protein
MDKYDTLEYSWVKVSMVSMHLLLALTIETPEVHEIIIS